MRLGIVPGGGVVHCVTPSGVLYSKFLLEAKYGFKIKSNLEYIVYMEHSMKI
jgi:hypothetical protein